jgi:hypothetical protein
MKNERKRDLPTGERELWISFAFAAGSKTEKETEFEREMSD